MEWIFFELQIDRKMTKLKFSLNILFQINLQHRKKDDGFIVTKPALKENIFFKVLFDDFRFCIHG